MTTQTNSADNVTILDEIIDNAVELPLESQDLLLMMAKAMKYTHDCVVRQKEAEMRYKTAERRPT